MAFGRILKFLAVAILVGIVGGCVFNAKLSSTVTATLESSPQYRDGKFYNTRPRKQYGLARFAELAGFWLKAEKIDTVPTRPIPVQSISRAQLAALSDDMLHLIRLGHSSILLKVYGEYWLIDPVFAERVSPLSFIGPKRFHRPPISIEALPPVSRVLISHNHYDHLDKAAIQALSAKTEQFLVPLGVNGDIEKWGVDPSKIVSFDWWQELAIGETLVAFTPSHHLSGRGLSDRNSTLWGSWVIKTPVKSLYFSGDSGYFAGFKAIGEKYGPFDLTMMENGAYNKEWPDAHMFPEESVKAHVELRGKMMLPIHNGTFPLSFHPWYDPFERVSAAAKKQGVQLLTPVVGEVLTLEQPVETGPWWESVKTAIAQ